MSSDNKRFEALRKAKEARASFNFRGNDDPVCPHCGETCEIAENELYRLMEEGEHQIDCPSCDEEFCVSTNVRYSFSTDEQEAMDDDEEPTSEKGTA